LTGLQPTPKQKEAHRIASESEIVLFGGAIRGAKTFWLFLENFHYAFTYKGSRWLFLRQSETTLKRNTFPSFNQFLSTGVDQYVDKWDMSTLTVNWINGSQTVFMAESYDHDKELNRFRGLEINGAFLDELNELQEVTFDKVIERSGSWTHAQADKHGNPCPVKILASCNPSHNWVRERFYEKHLTNTLPKGWAYVPAKITDNPHVPQAYLDNLRNNLPKMLYEKFVEGDWDAVDVKKPFAYSFKQEHISSIAQFNPDLYVYLSFDFNIDPATCAVFQFTEDYIYQIDEFHLKTSSIYELCEHIKVKYPNSVYLVTGDASGWAREKATAGLINMYEIIEAQLRIPRAATRTPRSNGLIRDSRVLLNSILEHQNFFINPICKETIKSLSFCETDENGDIPNKMEHLKHHLDTVRYFFNTFFYKYVKLY